MFNIEDLPISKFVVIGSYALQTRYAKDVDVICYLKDIQVVEENLTCISNHTVSFEFNGKKIECLLADVQSSCQQVLSASNKKCHIASRELCYAIKIAHIHRAHPQWEKHIHDYTNLSKEFPSYLRHKVIPEFKEKRTHNIESFSKMHKQTLDSILPKQHQVPLKGITKDEFFDDYVVKVVDHDWLHEVYAHEAKPIYTLLQKDKDIVYCEPTLWNNLTHVQQLYCVLEECYVIATERFLIKDLIKGKVFTPYEIHKAFKSALIKVCTTLTSGFFRDFAVEHYFNLLNNYNTDFLIKLQIALKEESDVG